MKEKRITAYLLRVDERTGVSCKGYLSEVDNDLKAEQDYVNYGHSIPLNCSWASMSRFLSPLSMRSFLIFSPSR